MTMEERTPLLPSALLSLWFCTIDPKWSRSTLLDQTAIQRQIDNTDRQIDQVVYELHGLTVDEIKIVEGAAH